MNEFVNPPCSKCGGVHLFDTSINNEKWNMVIRANNFPDYLCFYCICEIFSKIGEGFIANLWGNGFTGESIKFSPK